ncbi:hypothetical protein RUM44_009282 [Polyplax serrata]|uniref:Uncharacterized protein n=1 Tax=Polyplax serrata TaxID=468196 RepID=A0ABR1AS95_POLSC
MTTESSETDVKGPKRTDGLGAFDTESGFYFNGRRTKPGNGAYPFPNGAGFPIPGFNINSRYPYFNPVGESDPGYGAFGNPTKFGGSSSASSAASQSFSNGGFSGSSSNAASQSFSNGEVRVYNMKSSENQRLFEPEMNSNVRGQTFECLRPD